MLTKSILLFKFLIINCFFESIFGLYEDIKIFDESKNPCQSSPCKNDGTCNFEINKASLYYCSCKDEFKGLNCETNNYDCKRSLIKCQNGVCEYDNKANIYRCICPVLYKGLKCENFDDYTFVPLFSAIICVLSIFCRVIMNYCKKKTINLNANEDSCDHLELNQLQQTSDILSYQEAIKNSSIVEPVAEVDFNLPLYDQAIKMNRSNV